MSFRSLRSQPPSKLTRLLFTLRSGGYGACGWSISNSDWSVALKGSMFDPSGGYGGGSKWCGKKLVVTGNGVTATVTVAGERL